VDVSFRPCMFCYLKRKKDKWLSVLQGPEHPLGRPSVATPGVILILAASTRPCGGDGVLIKKQSSRISIFNLYLEGKESQEAASIARNHTSFGRTN